MTPELHQLRCFVAAAEELSFTAAARRVYVSQQALSRVIAQLERGLGIALFERTTRSVTLTEAGRAMLPAARRALAAAAEAVAAAQAAAGTSGPLRTDISSGGIETGAIVLRRMRREHPELAVEQVEHGVPRGLRLLLDGGLDVLLGLAGELPAGVRALAVRREAVLVGMAAGHPLARAGTVTVAALGDTPLLLPSDELAPEWNRFVEEIWQAAGLRARRHAVVTHGSVAAAELVREGACVVPTMAWTDPPAGLVFRPLSGDVPRFTWSAMWRDGAETRPGVDAFLTAASGVAAERGWLDGDA